MWLKEKNKEQYDISKLLVDIDPAITLPQLLDVSPKLRRDLADLFRSSQPISRSKRVNNVNAARGSAKSSEVDDSAATKDVDVECLYIPALVNGVLIDNVLVDGGSMIELVGHRKSISSIASSNKPLPPVPGGRSKGFELCAGCIEEHGREHARSFFRSRAGPAAVAGRVKGEVGHT